MEALAFPNDLIGFLNTFAVGGVALLAMARGLVFLVDRILNAFGADIPEESYVAYAVITAIAILAIAAVGETLGMSELIGFQGIVWKVIAGVLGAIVVREVS